MNQGGKISSEKKNIIKSARGYKDGLEIKKVEKKIDAVVDIMKLSVENLKVVEISKEQE